MLYELVLQYLDTRVALRHAMAAKAALLLGLFCPTQSSNGVDPCTALVDWHSEADAGCDLFLAAGATCGTTPPVPNITAGRSRAAGAPSALRRAAGLTCQIPRHSATCGWRRAPRATAPGSRCAASITPTARSLMTGHYRKVGAHSAPQSAADITCSISRARVRCGLLRARPAIALGSRLAAQTTHLGANTMRFPSGQRGALNALAEAPLLPPSLIARTST